MTTNAKQIVVVLHSTIDRLNAIRRDAADLSRSERKTIDLVISFCAAFMITLDPTITIVAAPSPGASIDAAP